MRGYTEGFKDALSLLRFESEVEWHENRKFLKAEFPVDIYSDTVCSLVIRPFTRTANFRLLGYRISIVLYGN